MIHKDFFEKVDIVVVANHHRKALILDYLKDIPHKVSYTPDYELPESWSPEFEQFVRTPWGHLGQHRCLEGHKDAFKLCDKDVILVLEDDAVPNRKDWLDVIIDAFILIKDFEIVSVHGREIDFRLFNRSYFGKETNLCIPKNNKNFLRILGSLAYFINRKSIDRFNKHNYNGFPIDLFIANAFKICVIDPSPLNHDRSQGSLIDIM